MKINLEELSDSDLERLKKMAEETLTDREKSYNVTKLKGPRRSGKTTQAQAIATEAIRNQQRVLWVSDTHWLAYKQGIGHKCQSWAYPVRGERYDLIVVDDVKSGVFKKEKLIQALEKNGHLLIVEEENE